MHVVCVLQYTFVCGDVFPRELLERSLCGWTVGTRLCVTVLYYRFRSSSPKIYTYTEHTHGLSVLQLTHTFASVPFVLLMSTTNRLSLLVV